MMCEVRDPLAEVSDLGHQRLQPGSDDLLFVLFFAGRVDNLFNGLGQPALEQLGEGCVWKRRCFGARPN
ncbi:hypothetical protein RSAG8_02864, partial [Rhizoctonia solani AG-8 WAC10335]